MRVSKKKLIAGLAWVPLGLLTLGHQIFVQPALVGTLFGDVVSGMLFWCLFFPFAISISYAITMALYGALLGVCFIILSVAWFVDNRVDGSWLEGDVRILPSLSNAIRVPFEFIKLIAYMLYHSVRFYIDGMARIYDRHFGPSEIEKIRDAYARGELSDLEMEQQIEEAMEDDE